MNIYIDHNIIDDVGKGAISIRESNQITWIYSDENFNEIKRAGDRRFLRILGDLKARKIELILNEQFQITGEARILEISDPELLYEKWIDAVDEIQIDEEMNLEFIGRLFGADNKDSILSHPTRFRNQIAALLEPHGLYGDQTKQKVNGIANELEGLVSGSLQKVGELEKTRETLGTHKGRAGNLKAHENPLEEIWKLIRSSCGGLTADQFFGFDPIDKQGYEEWPLYLGIIGCHTVLNFIGYKSDKGLSKIADLPGILSDGAHIGMAAYCSAVLSQDRRFCSKARAIYKYKNIGTKVLKLQARKC